ncbi:MAG: DNA mismatch repair protein MutT, partial [Acidobacteria bacterium]
MTRSFRQPAVTVDIIIFAILRERLKVLLIK